VKLSLLTLFPPILLLTLSLLNLFLVHLLLLHFFLVHLGKQLLSGGKSSGRGGRNAGNRMSVRDLQLIAANERREQPTSIC
jgi:hypothetical protein